jgi:hypothetical protein
LDIGGGVFRFHPRTEKGAALLRILGATRKKLIGIVLSESFLAGIAGIRNFSFVFLFLIRLRTEGSMRLCG